MSTVADVAVGILGVLVVIGLRMVWQLHDRVTRLEAIEEETRGLREGRNAPSSR